MLIVHSISELNKIVFKKYVTNMFQSLPSELYLTPNEKNVNKNRTRSNFG